MEYQIALVPGDGIGPEVVAEAVKVLKRVGEVYGHTFRFETVLAGGAAIDATGECLPAETLTKCKAADAVLLGAVGGPKWDELPGEKRPEKALLGLRKGLGLYANLRPAMIFPELSEASPLKPSVLGGRLDILIVRELTGGIYFGKHETFPNDEGQISARDIEEYSEREILRIGRTAFSMAQKRDHHVTSVDKANVLDTSRLWRKTMTALAEEYPDVTLDHMYVDNASMQLIRDPKHFDVIVTSNMFGDILSDEASQITGSIGMLPSASLADGNFGMYEPVHGSAPDIAGKNLANPIATILSVAMLLRYTLDLPTEANSVEAAVKAFLHEGYRTADIAVADTPALGTKETGDQIAALIE